MEYYRTQEGKFKKQIQNGKRGKLAAKADLGNKQEETGQDLALDQRRFDARMVCYLRMVISLIEGRRMRMDEILEMLARVVRQHSMVRRRRIDYVLQYFKKNSP